MPSSINSLVSLSREEEKKVCLLCLKPIDERTRIYCRWIEKMSKEIEHRLMTELLAIINYTTVKASVIRVKILETTDEHLCTKFTTKLRRR